MDYANNTNVEFIVDPKILFRGWLIYSYLHISWSSDCQESVQIVFFDNIMTWSYCLHRRYSMSRQKNSILLNEHALNHEPVPLIVSNTSMYIYADDTTEVIAGYNVIEEDPLETSASGQQITEWRWTLICNKPLEVGGGGGGGGGNGNKRGRGGRWNGERED